jgi:hypothetical protein
MPIQLGIVVQSNLDHLPTKTDLTFIDRAVRDAAEYIRGVWVSAVTGTILPGMSGPVNDEDYARSLGVPTSLARTGTLQWTIMSDHEHAERIELGYGSYDMKPGLLYGPNSRVGKDGRRYNTVPFRFGTPIRSGPNKGQSRPHFPGEQTMPADVYEIVRQGGAYPQTTEGQRTKVPFLFDEQGNASGGVNLEAAKRGEFPPMDGAYTWKTGLYSGMQGLGARGNRVYMTFRRVSEPSVSTRRYRRSDGKIVTTATKKGSDPNSWIHPGQKANPVIRAVRDYTRPHVESYLTGVIASR